MTQTFEHKKSVCVFCGASNDIPEHFFKEGYRFGEKLAALDFHLVYGAGGCGVMGAVADGVLDSGGTVTGVFPRILEGLEAKHDRLTEAIVVDDMHARKMTMFNKSDAFVILPGGFGTMDETFEVITWKQLHTHNKPIILYNYKNYWEYWTKCTEHFMAQGFAKPETRKLYEVVDDMDDVITHL